MIRPMQIRKNSLEEALLMLERKLRIQPLQQKAKVKIIPYVRVSEVHDSKQGPPPPHKGLLGPKGLPADLLAVVEYHQGPGVLHQNGDTVPSLNLEWTSARKGGKTFFFCKKGSRSSLL